MVVPWAGKWGPFKEGKRPGAETVINYPKEKEENPKVAITR